MSIRLWIAAFVGQVAWMFDMEIGYLLVYWSCSTGQRFVLPVATVVAFAIALSGAVVSWRESQRLAAGADLAGADAIHIERFVAVAGIALNAMAMIVILAMGVPRIMLDPCK